MRLQQVLCKNGCMQLPNICRLGKESCNFWVFKEVPILYLQCEGSERCFSSPYVTATHHKRPYSCMLTADQKQDNSGLCCLSAAMKACGSPVKHLFLSFMSVFTASSKHLRACRCGDGWLCSSNFIAVTALECYRELQPGTST